MKKNNMILIIITIIVILSVIGIATYAYFATGNLNITNAANINTVTERNNMVFDTIGGGMILNITAANMAESLSGNVAAQNNTTLTVNFTSNTEYSMVCTYDIVYEWTSSDKYTAHTTGVSSNEFTIQGTLASNAHVSEGTNSIKNEKDLSTLSYTNYAATVVSGAQIDGTGNTTSTAVWTLSSKFYNVSQDQSALSGKTYSGRFKVANVSCTAGTVPEPGPTSYWFDTNTLTFPASGGSASGHNAYIGQDSSKYYACATIQGHEVCLSQPYTQYGLEGHTLNSDLTTTQRTSAKNAILQVFNDAGINIGISSCSASRSSAYCRVGDMYCYVHRDGYVYCGDNGANELCRVNASGGAHCQ